MPGDGACATSALTGLGAGGAEEHGLGCGAQRLLRGAQLARNTQRLLARHGSLSRVPAW
jgi:hypothetical protein